MSAPAIWSAHDARGKSTQLGHTAPAIPRLGIPEYNWWNEGLHGVARAGTATVFPQAIAMAATFDEPLMHQTADVISTEFRAKYVETRKPDGGTDWYRGLTVWSPNINIFRDPRWGRGQETYGEDPYLTSRMGVAFITGLQGDDAKYLKTVATSKHFAVHSGPESSRHTADVHPSAHDLEDTYLPAFRATVTEGKVQSIMCVYNSVDGIPGCANDMLMEDHLRKAWGFGGYVVSDCGAAANIFRPDAHHWKPDAASGRGGGIHRRHGPDLRRLPQQHEHRARRHRDRGADRTDATGRDRSLPGAAVHRAPQARAVDPPASVPFAKITAQDNDTAAHREQTLLAAKKSLVLLKNSGLLPLAKQPAASP